MLKPTLEVELVWYLGDFAGDCGLKSWSGPLFERRRLGLSTGFSYGSPETPPSYSAAIRASKPRRALASVALTSSTWRDALVVQYGWPSWQTPSERAAIAPLGRMAGVILLTPHYRKLAARVNPTSLAAMVELARKSGHLPLFEAQANVLFGRACASYASARRELNHALAEAS